MSSREDILQNIRRNTRVRYEKPDLSALEQEAITYANSVAQFTKVVAEVGGRVVEVKDGEDINDLIRKLYPDAKRIASNLKEITCATFHPDEVAASADLDGTDLAVVRGRIGVCENGAVWVEQDVEQRAVYFISEALILLLDRKIWSITCMKLTKGLIQVNMVTVCLFRVLQKLPILSRHWFWELMVHVS